MNPWWTEQTSALIGGIGGGGLGVLCGCLGAAMGWLIPRGKGKTAIFAVIYVLLAFGAVGLGTGIIALLSNQPYHIYYPLLLIGSLMSIVPLVLRNIARTRFGQIEQRRFDAEQFRRA